MGKPIGLTIVATGDNAVVTALGKAARGLSDFTPLWKRLEADWYEIQTQAFGSEGASTGGKWAPLSPPYARAKRRTHPGRSILVRSGDLRDGLTRSGGAGQVRRVTATTLELGTSHRAAMYHDRGTGRMPRRQVIRLAPEQRAHWFTLAEEFAAGVLKTAGVGA